MDAKATAAERRAEYEAWYEEQVRLGLEDLDAGRVVSDEDVRKHFKKRLEHAGRHKSRPLEWSERSRADHHRIYDYYLEAAPYDIAEQAIRAMMAQARRMAESRLVYRPGRTGTRECVMRRFGYGRFA